MDLTLFNSLFYSLFCDLVVDLLVSVMLFSFFSFFVSNLFYTVKNASLKMRK